MGLHRLLWCFVACVLSTSFSKWTCPDGCEEYPTTVHFGTNLKITRATNPVSKRSTQNDISDLSLHVVKRDLSANQMIVTAVSGEERSATEPHHQISKLVETLRNNRIHFRKRTIKASVTLLSTLPYKNTTTLESTKSSESEIFHGAIRLKPKSETTETQTSSKAMSESSKRSPVKKSKPKNFHGAIRLKPKSGKLAHKKLRSTLPHTRGKKATKLRSHPTKRRDSKKIHGAIRLKPKPKTKSPKKLGSILPYTRHKKATKLISLATKSAKRSKSKNLHGAIRLMPKSSGTKSPKKLRSTLPYSRRKKVTKLTTKRRVSKSFRGPIRLMPKSSGTKSPKKLRSTLPYSRRKKVTTKRSVAKNFHGAIRLKPKSRTKSPKTVGNTLPYTSRNKSTILENPSPESVYCLRRRVVHGTDRFRINSKKLKWMESGHFFRVYRLKPSLFTGSPFRFRHCPTPTNASSTLFS